MLQGNNLGFRPLSPDESMGAPVGSSMGAPVGSSMGAPVGSSMGAPVGSSMGAPVGSSMGAPVGSSMGAPAGSPLDTSVEEVAQLIQQLTANFAAENVSDPLNQAVNSIKESGIPVDLIAAALDLFNAPSGGNAASPVIAAAEEGVQPVVSMANGGGMMGFRPLRMQEGSTPEHKEALRYIKWAHERADDRLPPELRYGPNTIVEVLSIMETNPVLAIKFAQDLKGIIEGGPPSALPDFDTPVGSGPGNGQLNEEPQGPPASFQDLIREGNRESVRKWLLDNHGSVQRETNPAKSAQYKDAQTWALEGTGHRLWSDFFHSQFQAPSTKDYYPPFEGSEDDTLEIPPSTKDYYPPFGGSEDDIDEVPPSTTFPDELAYGGTPRGTVAGELEPRGYLTARQAGETLRERAKGLRDRRDYDGYR